MLKKLLKILLDPAPVQVAPEKEIVTQEQIQTECLSQDVLSQFEKLKSLDQKVDFLRQLSSRKMAKIIIRSLDEILVLEKLLSYIGDAGVMSEARKRLATLVEIKESSTAVRALRRLEKCVENASQKAQSDTWYDGFSLFDEMKKEWETFSSTAAETAEFAELEKKYFSVCASFESRVAEQELIHHNRMMWETLCRDIESLQVVTGEEDKVRIALEEYIEKRDIYPALPPAFSRKFENRFDFAKERIKSELEKHNVALEKKAIILSELESVVQKAENAASNIAIFSLDVLSPLLTRFEADVKHAYDAEASLRQRFSKAYDTVKKRISDRNEERVAKEQAHKIALKELVDAANEIVKIPLNQENIKQLTSEMNVLSEKFIALHPSPVESLAELFKEAEFRFKNARRTLYNCEDQERCASYACKLKLCEVVEIFGKQLKNDDDFRDVAAALRTFRSDWKQLGPVPREKNEEIWARFNTACELIHQWLLPRFEEADKLKAHNLEQKEALIEQLKSLIDDGELSMKEAQLQFERLAEQFKAIGPVPEANIKTIFDTYRDYSKQFFAKRQAHFNVIKERIKEAQNQKNKLIEKSVDLVQKTWQEGLHIVKDLRAEWKASGFAGKEENEKLWKTFNAHIQAFYDREKENAKSNMTTKVEICETIEALADQKLETINLKMTNEQLKIALEKWKTTGPVPEEESQLIFDRFKSAMDKIHLLLKAGYDTVNQEREISQKTKEDLLSQLESILNSDLIQSEKAEKIKAIQVQWNACGQAFREIEDQLRAQFKELCDDFFANRKAEFANIKAQQIENLKRKKEICMKLENLADISSPNLSKEGKLSIESMAQELSLAFSMNVMSNIPTSREDRIAMAIELQQKWREIGPVPRDESQTIFDRYRRAGDAIFGKRNPPPAQKEKNTPSQQEQKADVKDEKTTNVLQKDPIVQDESHKNVESIPQNGSIDLLKDTPLNEDESLTI